VGNNLKALVLAIVASGIALSSTTYAADRAKAVPFNIATVSLVY
jgi:hypothetical protein